VIQVANGHRALWERGHSYTPPAPWWKEHPRFAPTSIIQFCDKERAKDQSALRVGKRKEGLKNAM